MEGIARARRINAAARDFEGSGFQEFSFTQNSGAAPALGQSDEGTAIASFDLKKGDVRIFDPNVAVARLRGANRRYIEEEIPHISSLMCGDVEEFLARADVLVVGSLDDEATRVLKAATARHVIVDLSRSLGRSPSAPVV